MDEYDGGAVIWHVHADMGRVGGKVNGRWAVNGGQCGGGWWASGGLGSGGASGRRTGGWAGIERALTHAPRV